jgi:hypothetical protein
MARLALMATKENPMNHLVPIGCVAALAVAAITPPPAAAENELFTAMARLVAHSPGSEPLPGEWKDGTLVDILLTSSGVESHVMSPGGDPCVLVHLMTSQQQGEWATLSTKTYDFRKLVSARFLADGDSLETAPSRTDDDPEATEVLLEGAAWSVHRVVHINPAKPGFDQYIEDTWSIVVLGQVDRSAISNALGIVRPQCFAQQ